MFKKNPFSRRIITERKTAFFGRVILFLKAISLVKHTSTNKMPIIRVLTVGLPCMVPKLPSEYIRRKHWTSKYNSKLILIQN